jgi:hypothetical protein
MDGCREPAVSIARRRTPWPLAESGPPELQPVLVTRPGAFPVRSARDPARPGLSESGTLRVPRCGFLSPRLGDLREDLVQLVEVERMLPCLADTATSDVKDERHCALDGLASSRRGNTVQTNHCVVIGQQIL